MNLTRLIRYGAVCAAFALTVRPGCAGSGDIAGFGGVASINNNGGSHAFGGVSAGVNVHPRLGLFGEMTYLPIDSIDRTVNGVNVSGKWTLNSFGGGLRIGLVDPKSRVVPYALGVFGVSRDKLSGTARAIVSGKTVAQTYSESESHAYGGGGGGVNLYIGHSWGVRPEVRYQRYAGGAGILSVTGGIFFQFGD